MMFKSPRECQVGEFSSSNIIIAEYESSILVNG